MKNAQERQVQVRAMRMFPIFAPRLYTDGYSETSDSASMRWRIVLLASLPMGDFEKHTFSKRCLSGLAVLAALPWLGCAGSPEAEPTPVGDHGLDHGLGQARGFALEPMLAAEVGLDAPVPRPSPGGWPAVAFDGSNYLVVWEDFRALRTVLYGARMAPDGTTLDPMGFPILDDVVPTGPYSVNFVPTVAFDGSNFLVVVRDEDEIRGVRVSPAGEVLDPGGFPISAAGIQSWNPALAFDGCNYLVVWAHAAYPPSAADGLYWARVAPDGTVLDPGGVQALPLSETSPVTASFDGSNYLLTWIERDPDANVMTLYGARLSPAGTMLDQPAFPISPAGVYVFNRSQAAGFDGTSHVVTWAMHDEDEVENVLYATRISPQGTVRDPDGIVLAVDSGEFASVTRVDMAAGNDRSIIAFSQNGSDDGGSFSLPVGVAVLTADGTARRLPASDQTRGLEAAIAAGDAGAMLVWRQGRDASSAHPPVVAAVLDDQGAVVDAEGISPAAPANAQEVRAVASDGHIFFVIWTDTRDLESEGEALYGVRVAADGSVLDDQAIELTAAADELADVASVVFDGANFLVTWAQHYGGEGSNSQIRAVRVSPAGELLDATPLYLPLNAPSRQQMVPAAATDGTHTLLVAQGDSLESYALAAVLLDQQGESVSPVVTLVDYEQRRMVFEPAVAFDGTGYLVVWHSTSQVFGQRVSASGALVGERLTIATGKDGIARSTLAFGNDFHFVVWQDASGLHGTRVTADGQVLDAEGLPIAATDSACGIYGNCCHNLPFSGGSCAAVVAVDDGFMVAWRAPAVAGTPSSIDLHGAVLAGDGAVLDSFAISEAPEREGMATLAANAAGQVLTAYSRFVPEAPYSAHRARARLLTAPGEPGPGPSPDAGVDPGPGPDAGPDAGVDPGPGPDAGGSPGTPGPGPGDGGCSAGGSQPGNALLVLLTLGGWLAWRRRARASAFART